MPVHTAFLCHQRLDMTEIVSAIHLSRHQSNKKNIGSAISKLLSYCVCGGAMPAEGGILDTMKWLQLLAVCLYQHAFATI